MATKTMKNDWKKAMGLAPDFPLSRRRGENRWCKKIGGRLRYFTGTADEALAEWERTKDDLLAGRTPRAKSSQLATVEYVVNRFLAHKEAAVTSGELSPRSFERYESTGKRIAAFLGRHTLAEELGPDNFEALRADMSKTLGPVALGNEIGIVRSIFRFASEMCIIEKVVRFGPGFKKPSAKTLRKERAKGGPKRFSREQITALLKAASPTMKAMVLLGINCGFGNTDCGMLPVAAIDMEGGWIEFPRPKTEMPRRCPLWPETVEAIRDSLKHRPAPIDPKDAGLLFIAANGKNYLGEHRGHRVVEEFDRLMKAADVVGRSFYDLRRTFQTEAEDSPDLVAIKSIMGHVASGNDMSARYRQGVKDDRLIAVVNVVRKWLFPESPKDDAGRSATKKKATAKPAPEKRQTPAAEDGPRLRIVG